MALTVTPPEIITDTPSVNAQIEVGTSGVYEAASITLGNFRYVNSAGTVTVNTGPGVLISIVVGKSTTGTVTVYDNTAGSGTIITSFGTGTGTFGFSIGARYANGLTVVTTASDNITLIYV